MTSTKSQSIAAGETSPLLSLSQADPLRQSNARLSNARRVPKTLAWVVLIGLLLVSCGDQLMESPQTRILEAIVCYTYYEKADPTKIQLGRAAVGPGAIGGVAEMWCKTGPVQAEVASLRGWQQLFEGIPVLLLAVPVGWAADRYGRKPILLLGMVAFVLRASWIQLVTWFWTSFDIHAIWYSAIFGSIGGGSAATTSVFYVLLSDITTEADRAEAFVRIGAFNLLAALLMPPLAAVLMEINPWIPNLVGTLLMLLTLFTFAYVPETLPYNRPSPSLAAHAPPMSPMHNEQYADDISATEGTQKPDVRESWVATAKHAVAFFTNDWRIAALIAPFTIHILMMSVSQLLLQYVSTRYAVKLSEAIMITTIRMGVITLLLFVILPYISTLLMKRYRLSVQQKDLYLTRASFLLVAVGWLLTGLSSNIAMVIISLAISALGIGAAPLLRSFLTSLIETHHIARVYAVISVVDSLGVMAGSPLMADLFRRGVDLGGFWMGLPFFFLGLMAACFAIVLFAVKLRQGEDQCSSLEQDQ